MVMGRSILIKYYEDLRYSLVPSDVLIVTGCNENADKYRESGGICGRTVP